MSVAYTVPAPSYVILGCKFTNYYRNYRQDIANFNFVKLSHDSIYYASVLTLATPLFATSFYERVSFPFKYSYFIEDYEECRNAKDNSFHWSLNKELCYFCMQLKKNKDTMASFCGKYVSLQSKLLFYIICYMAVRNVQLDMAKGIAIILMIIGHCLLFGGTVRYLIFSFHMPFFFIFSGYFFRNKPIKDVINSGIERLVKPYLIYAIVMEVLLKLLNMKGCITGLIEILFAHGGPKYTMIFPTETYLGAIWFLMAIFWCKIFYAIIYIKCKNNIYLSVVIAFAISWLAIYVGKYLINMPFGILTGASGLAFYGVGPILRNVSSKLLYITIPIWLIAVLSHLSYVDMVNFEYIFYPFDFICAIGGSLFVFLISGFFATIVKTRFLATIGAYSLEILCVHFLVMRTCDIIDYSSNSLPFFLANITIPIILPLAYYKLKLGKIYD